MSTSTKNPPNPDEFELSLFGPGIGEALAVHLGNGEWMIVDSCMGEDGSTPIALEYLRDIGVNVEAQVRLVVATHWHDDHICGLSKILRLSESAKFVCSDAVRNEELIALAVASKNIKLVELSAGASELADILSILDARVGEKGCFGPDIWASARKELYKCPHGRPIAVLALSPSDQTLSDCKLSNASISPKVGDIKRRVPNPGPNETSVALLIRFGEVGFLLGADLTAGADDRRGWRAVALSFGGDISADTYKVAHHGSVGADIPGIWDRLLTTNPYALITPYARGRKPLPSSTDLLRIQKYTNQVYCTVWPPTISPPTRDSVVERTLREVAKCRRSVRKLPGHIRVRNHLDSGMIRIDVFDGATRVRLAPN